MDYRKFGDTYYLRFDKGEEVISGIKTICQKENIASATFSGIGGCSAAAVQTFLPEKGTFMTEEMEGLLELVCCMGNIVTDQNGALQSHTHALFAYMKGGKHFTIAGHLKSTTVLYTAEIELRPVMGGTIYHLPNEETGTGFWHFK